MLMSAELMNCAIPVGDNRYHFDVALASKAQLQSALIFEESYSEIYGHPIFDNLDEMLAATKM